MRATTSNLSSLLGVRVKVFVGLLPGKLAIHCFELVIGAHRDIILHALYFGT